MTPREFKAWFDGFTEAFTGCPTKAQWARIKERVAEIDGNPVTERVYIDRYWASLSLNPYYGYPHFYTGTASGLSGLAGNLNGNAHQHGMSGNAALQQYQNFQSLTAMNALGRADAQTLDA